MALEVIPRTLASNCGADVVRVITKLRAKHIDGNGRNWGISKLNLFKVKDGNTGEIADMTTLDIWEPLEVKK